MIKLNNINKIFKQKHQSFQALKDVSLDFDEGEFAVIAGPSGSGKTTLLNIIGLLDKATSGEYIFDDQSIAKKSSRSLADIRREKIGFVFQAYNLMPVLTALENTEMVMELSGLDKSSIRKAAMETLTAVGLGDLADRYPDQLSGGQQQRVAVARAIASKPRLVIADEPTANLDSATAVGLMELMEKLNQEHGVTFIFSSHDPEVISRAKRVIRLRDGQVVDDTQANAEAGDKLRQVASVSRIDATG